MRVLTPRDDQIVAAARTGAALFGRDDLLAVRVRGRDAGKFLHNMLTQEIKALQGTATACLCDAQGAIIAAMRVFARPDGFDLWTDRGRAPLLLESLDKYVIADDVELTMDEEQFALVEVVGPQAMPLLQAARLADRLEQGSAVAGESGGAEGSPLGPPQPTVWMTVARDELGDVAGALIAAGATAGSQAAREALRIGAGEAKVGRDFDDGSLPQEVGMRAAVNFRKGCYLGQEAIAMQHYRGQLRRHLCWLRCDGAARPDTGWALRTPDGKKAGRMGTSFASASGDWLGLGMVQRKCYAAGGTLVASGEDGQSCEVTILATTAPGVFAEPAAGAAP